MRIELAIPVGKFVIAMEGEGAGVQDVDPGIQGPRHVRERRLPVPERVQQTQPAQDGETVPQPIVSVHDDHALH